MKPGAHSAPHGDGPPVSDPHASGPDEWGSETGDVIRRRAIPSCTSTKTPHPWRIPPPRSSTASGVEDLLAHTSLQGNRRAEMRIRSAARLQFQTQQAPRTPRAQSSDDSAKRTKLAFARNDANRMPKVRRVSSSVTEELRAREPARPVHRSFARARQTTARRSTGRAPGARSAHASAARGSRGGRRSPASRGRSRSSPA